MGCSNGKVETINGNFAGNGQAAENQVGTKSPLHNNNNETVIDADQALNSVDHIPRPVEESISNEDDKPIVEDVTDDDTVKTVAPTGIAEDPKVEEPAESEPEIPAEDGQDSQHKESAPEGEEKENQDSEEDKKSEKTEPKGVGQPGDGQEEANKDPDDGKESGEKEKKRDETKNSSSAEDKSEESEEKGEAQEEKDPTNEKDELLSTNNNVEIASEFGEKGNPVLESVPEADETSEKNSTEGSAIVRDDS